MKSIYLPNKLPIKSSDIANYFLCKNKIEKKYFPYERATRPPQRKLYSKLHILHKFSSTYVTVTNKLIISRGPVAIRRFIRDKQISFLHGEKGGSFKRDTRHPYTS